MDFLYTIRPESDEPIMLVNKHVGYLSEEGYGIMGEQFERELMFLDELGKKRIQVWINSYGGSVKDGYSIYNAILKSKTKVDTYCIGIAASIAAVIFQSGRKRMMNDYAILMYHNAYIPSDEISEEDKKHIEVTNESIAKMICARSGKSYENVCSLMAKTTFMSAEEALQNGFCDGIDHSSESNKPRLSSMAVKDAWDLSNKILNKATNTLINKSKMKQLCNKLGLNEDANEQSILNAIESIQNKYNASLTDVKNLNKKVDDLTEENSTLKTANEDFKKKSQDAEKVAKEIKAKDLINSFVKTGQIQNNDEVIKSWEEKAVEDFDGIKNMLEKLPLNKKSPEIITAIDGQKSTHNMAATMAEIAKNKNK